MEEYSRPATLDDLKALIESLNDQGNEVDVLDVAEVPAGSIGGTITRWTDAV